MTISDIFAYVKDNTGESDETYLLRELRYVIARIWNGTDLLGSLFTITVQPTTERITTLPYYVQEIRGARRAADAEVTLYSPAQYFRDNSGYQWPLTWTVMNKTPLMTDYTNHGKLTLKLRQAAKMPFKVSLVGSGEFGVEVREDVEFAVGDTEHETVEVFRNLTRLGKSVKFTNSDVLVYDISNSVIAVLPSNLDNVLNLKIQLVDAAATNLNTVCQSYVILFKMIMPTVQSATDVLDDQFGEAVRNLLVAQLLAKSNTTADMNRMKFHGKQGANAIRANQVADSAGHAQKLNIAREPHGREFVGYL
jgi:hypothetical protein